MHQPWPDWGPYNCRINLMPKLAQDDLIENQKSPKNAFFGNYDKTLKINHFNSCFKNPMDDQGGSLIPGVDQNWRPSYSFDLQIGHQTH